MRKHGNNQFSWMQEKWLEKFRTIVSSYVGNPVGLARSEYKM